MAKQSKALPDPGQLVSDSQLAERFGVSRSTIWAWASSGLLPQPIRFGRRTTRWVLADVEAAFAAMQRSERWDP